jgi:hypothetical protein
VASTLDRAPQSKDFGDAHRTPALSRCNNRTSSSTSISFLRIVALSSMPIERSMAKSFSSNSGVRICINLLLRRLAVKVTLLRVRQGFWKLQSTKASGNVHEVGGVYDGSRELLPTLETKKGRDSARPLASSGEDSGLSGLGIT